MLGENSETSEDQDIILEDIEPPIGFTFLDNKIMEYVDHSPLLPSYLASLISSLSMASRVSLRFASIAVDTIFESLKFSTATTLGLGRRTLVSAVSSARSLHHMIGKEKELSFYNILDNYTNTSVYMINMSFSLAELLCLSTFHLYSASIRFTLEMAEETVQIFDGLFGNTETSKALAAMIVIFLQELQGHDDALGLTQRFGKIYALGQMAKALTAYCCLQYMNKKRWRQMVKLHPIFQTSVTKKGGYDPAAQVKTKDMFSNSDPLNSPIILRRKSLEVFTPKPQIKKTKSSDNFKRLRTKSEEIPQKLFEPLTKLKPFNQIKLGSRYVKFAVGAYGTNFLKIMGIEKPREVHFNIQDHHNHHSMANHTDIPVEHIITSSYNEPTTLHPPKINAPVHYVAVDHATSSVIVSLRGTLGLSDLVTDITANYCFFKYDDGIEGYVHSGIFQSAIKISNSPIRDAVSEALIKHPGFSLVLTGHSLGAGCAALLTLLWSTKIVNEDGSLTFLTDKNKGFPERPIHSFLYACPAIMSAELSRHFKKLMTTFVYRHDIVPCLSLGLVRDFRNITVSLCHEEGMAEGVIGKVLGIFKEHETGTTQRDELWYWALLKTLRADMKADKLYPPGRVYWINANHDQLPKNAKPSTTLSLFEVDDVEIAFSEIIFSTSMFTDQYFILT
ncbi:hypothetical protein HDV04_005982 [Boothiomyces sp. JEL0838]|nr:hypothetical protein HDV04_005982 [Boothiomyces sp. JEL0838]